MKFSCEKILKMSTVHATGRKFKLKPESPFPHIYRAKQSSCTIAVIPIEQLKEAIVVVDIEDKSTFYIKFFTAAEFVRA